MVLDVEGRAKPVARLFDVDPQGEEQIRMPHRQRGRGAVYPVEVVLQRGQLRLLEIGFLPGERVRVIAQGFPGPDPLAVRVGHDALDDRLVPEVQPIEIADRIDCAMELGR